MASTSLQKINWPSRGSHDTLKFGTVLTVSGKAEGSHFKFDVYIVNLNYKDGKFGNSGAH